MIHLEPGETADIDQRNALLRDAINVVLDGIKVIHFDGDPDQVRNQAEAVGHRIGQHIESLSLEETERLACTAVIRLAQRIRREQR